MAKLCTGFHEHQVVLLGLVFALLRGDLALVVQIRLVSNEHNDDVVPTLGSDVVNPLLGVLERLGIWSRRAVSSTHMMGSQAGTPPGRAGGHTRNVVDDNGNARIADVGGYEAAKSLLARGVPQL